MEMDVLGEPDIDRHNMAGFDMRSWSAHQNSWSIGKSFDRPMTETFGPVILARRAKSMRASTGNPHIKASLATERRTLTQFLTVVLARPVIIISEPIVAFTDLFLALEYAIFSLYFEAYPIIFKG